MKIDGASNRVGIGTSSPNAALDVDGAIVSGSSSKPINATYDSVGDMNSFEHRFTRVKNGANSPHVVAPKLSEKQRQPPRRLQLTYRIPARMANDCEWKYPNSSR